MKLTDAEIIKVIREQAAKSEYQAKIAALADTRKAHLEIAAALREGAKRLEAAG